LTSQFDNLLLKLGWAKARRWMVGRTRRVVVKALCLEVLVVG